MVTYVRMHVSIWLCMYVRMYVNGGDCHMSFAMLTMLLVLVVVYWMHLSKFTHRCTATPGVHAMRCRIKARH